jgi:hypothetical protein
MSTLDSLNPYIPPKPLEPDVVLDAVPDELEYRRAISYVFDNPNWIVNLLAVILCTIVQNVIPILPAMVLLGYQFEIIEALLARPNAPYPDFKFDQILRYLMRGLYPLLVALIVSLVAMPVIFVLLGIPVGLSAALLSNVDEDAKAMVLIVLIPVGVVALFILSFLLNLILIPMVLRAGLAQDIGSAFNFAFVKDFVSKMWKDVLYAGVFIMVAAVIAYIVGLLMLCVGIFFTIAVVQLGQAHLGMQLYRIYLLRGGEKILPKPADAIVYPSASPFTE